MEKINVLHLVPGLDAGGIEMMLLNYYKYIDRRKIQFDFAMFFDSVGLTGKEFQNMGSDIYHLTPKSKGFKQYKYELSEILRKNKYDIVHAHQNYMSFIPLYYAKKHGIKVRIAHSHSTSVDNSNLMNPFLRIAGIYLNNFTSTYKMSCGIEAGKYIFGEKSFNQGNVIVLPNAIETSKFSFSQIKRNEIRKELNIEGKFVIGNVGRLSEEKNHIFLLKIFKEIYMKKNDSCLVIVGDGYLDGKLKEFARELGIEQHIHFLGRRNDVNEILNAFDAFVLPSFHEGFPVVCIEAQTSGVKCFFSDKIPQEVSVTDQTEFISLDKSAEFWAEHITKSAFNYNRTDRNKEIKDSGYDIKENAKWLENFYIECLKKGMEK
ncbi:glycosyltransferase family 1 protein [Bacillus rhizoplanae]|uniref:glycosyltransferase family 1 protein n=1 Tax=Bacillus rhizoplanae TaxID=2880966 RepID=UPI003D1D2BE4